MSFYKCLSLLVLVSVFYRGWHQISFQTTYFWPWAGLVQALTLLCKGLSMFKKQIRETFYCIFFMPNRLTEPMEGYVVTFFQLLNSLLWKFACCCWMDFKVSQPFSMLQFVPNVFLRMIGIVLLIMQHALTLVFVETKKGADALEYWLSMHGLPASAIHGNKVQMVSIFHLSFFFTGRIMYFVLI